MSVEFRLLAVAITCNDAPRPCVFLPRCLGDGGFEKAVPPQVVFIDDATEVSAQFGLLAVVLTPYLGGFEGKAVLVASHVDTGARITVLPPRTTRARVLVDDREGQSGLLEADAGQDPAHTATDHHDWAFSFPRL